ncbi:class A sortase [Shouchella lehensis]|nr:class A sortase [Shouchella lehensis]
MSERLKSSFMLTSIVLLLVMGIVLLCSPFIRDYFIEQRIASAQQLFLTHSLHDHANTASIIDSTAIERPTFLEVMQEALQQNDLPIAGALSIPDVQLTLPIINGLTNEHLLAGAATLTDQQPMGSGNYVLFGHHLSKQTLLFGPLLHVKPSMNIYITNKTEIYQYTVFETNIISEHDTQYLLPTDEPSITLFTCDTSKPTTERFMVRAKLISKTTYEEGKEFFN